MKLCGRVRCHDEYSSIRMFFPHIEALFCFARLRRLLLRSHGNQTQFDDYTLYTRQMHNVTDLHMHEVTERIAHVQRTRTILQYMRTADHKRTNTNDKTNNCAATKRRIRFGTLERCNLSFIATVAATVMIK